MNLSKAFFLALLLFLPTHVLAEEKPRLDEKIIASTFKSLAKTYVSVVDLDQLKINNLHRLTKMSEEKFRKQYAKVYPVIKDLPPDVRTAYKIAPEMSKEQAMKNILRLDQEKIYYLIDAIPDRTIANLFRDYLKEAQAKIQEGNLAQEIRKLWEKIISRAQPK